MVVLDDILGGARATTNKQKLDLTNTTTQVHMHVLTEYRELLDHDGAEQKCRRARACAPRLQVEAPAPEPVKVQGKTVSTFNDIVSTKPSDQ